MINRLILPEAIHALSQFRALCITGPRQSGKTTLSKTLFKGKAYVNFENPSVQEQALKDPVGFLNMYKDGAVFDEVQRMPDIFHYLQEILDNNNKRGQFILTGSNNFLLQEKVSQSLAGRTGYLSLLPLSFEELKSMKPVYDDVDQYILRGGYPEIWTENLNANTWMSSYIQNYVQRDVRMIRNINNLAVFNRFVHLCANYSGQILNRTELAQQCGVDNKTVLAWLGLLENSYIIFHLQPHFSNLNKRIVKSPKLYFYDTGLLCSLLNIRSVNGLKKHPAYGSIFENWVISEIRKNEFNKGIADSTYYYRDNNGNEVDLILEKNEEPIAIEIKSNKKLNNNHLRGLKYWHRYHSNSQKILIYNGKESQSITENIAAIPWNEVAYI